MELRSVGYDHPDAATMIAALQQVYVALYGSPDETPVTPAEFAPPHGLFLIGYAGTEPVACGAWRARPLDAPMAGGAAELKRMYVVPHARGRGLARRILAELESTARAAGLPRMVLETGDEQPEAIALYTSSGYEPVPGFGLYRCENGSRYFGKALGGAAATAG